MRRVNAILGVAVLTAISSCSIKEEGLAVKDQQPVSFYGTMEDAASKAYVDEGFNGSWNKNDLLSIFYGSTFNKQYKYVGASGTTSGRFDPVSGNNDNTGDGELNYAIYPYDDYNACQSDGTLIVPFPKERTITSFPDGIGASIMLVAKSETTRLPFKHVAGYLGFQLYGENVSVASITLTSNGNEPFSGSANVVYDENDNLQVSFVDRDHEDDPTCTFIYEPAIALTATSENCKTFWITLPPTVLSSGLTLTVKDANGGVWEKVSSFKEVKVNKFQRFNPMQVIPAIPTVSVTGVTLAPASLTMDVGDTETLTATVSPADATDKTVTWSTSDANVATVDANGKVSAVAPGTATITVTTTDGGKTATCSVKVNDVISYRLAIDPASAEIDAGATKAFKAMLYTKTNDVEDEGTEVVATSWTSSKTAVATIADGTATGVAGGETTITAKYTPEGSSELEATATLKVKDVISYRLAIDPASAEIDAGATKAFKAMLYTKTNDVEDEGTEVVATSWTSSKTAVATIADGTATGVAGGETTITAKYTPEGSSELEATASLKVKDVITYSVTIDPAEDGKVIIGKTMKFTLYMTTITNDVPGEAEEVTSGITWTSDDATIATIANGTATGLKEGEVTITAKYTTPDNIEHTLTAPLTVTKDPNHAGDPIPIGGDENL